MFKLSSSLKLSLHENSMILAEDVVYRFFLSTIFINGM